MYTEYKTISIEFNSILWMLVDVAGESAEMKRKSHRKIKTTTKADGSRGRGRYKRVHRSSSESYDDEYEVSNRKRVQRSEQDDDDEKDEVEAEEEEEYEEEVEYEDDEDDAAEEDGTDDYNDETDYEEEKKYTKKLSRREHHSKTQKHSKRHKSLRKYRQEETHATKRSKEKILEGHVKRSLMNTLKSLPGVKNEQNRKQMYQLSLEITPYKGAYQEMSKGFRKDYRRIISPADFENFRKLGEGRDKFQADTFVMKLFDRSLDLCKFTERTPLYPICRAWMLNQPRNPSVGKYKNADNQKVMEREDNAVEILAKLKSGEIRKVKSMPKPLKADGPEYPVAEKPRKFSIDEDVVPENDEYRHADRDTLLQWHKERWNAVRQEWQRNAIKRRERYAINIMILKHLRRAKDSDEEDSLKNEAWGT